MSIKKRWPFAPIEEYLVQRGMTMQEYAEKNLPTPGRESVLEFYRKGSREGVLTLRAMDTICVDGLGVHPIQVYGVEMYFDPEYDGERATQPCIDCGGPKWGGVHRCEKCAAKNLLCACGCGRPTPSTRAKYAEKNHSPIYTKEGRRLARETLR